MPDEYVIAIGYSRADYYHKITESQLYELIQLKTTEEAEKYIRDNCKSTKIGHSDEQDFYLNKSSWSEKDWPTDFEELKADINHYFGVNKP